MHTPTEFSSRLGGNRSRPPNVIPLLGVTNPRRGGGPLELAAALRRVHAAGVRRGFLLLSPTPMPKGPTDSATTRWEVSWWVRLCHEIRVQTRLRVALVEAPGKVGVLSQSEKEWQRARVIPNLASGERAGVIELSRGVCTDDPALLEEARLLGIPTYEPAELVAAMREENLRELLAHPVAAALRASA